MITSHTHFMNEKIPLNESPVKYSILMILEIVVLLSLSTAFRNLRIPR